MDADVIRATARQYGITDLAAAFKIANFDKAAQLAVDRYVRGKSQQAAAAVQDGGGTPATARPEPPRTLEEARRAAAALLAEARRRGI